MLEKCARWIGQPVYFDAIVWPFAQLPGPREVILRLPSFLGFTVAAFLVYRVGRCILGVETAASAMLLFCAMASYYASDARPYALGLMCASGAILFLLRWMEHGKIVDALFYAIFAALTLYFHFLFGVMFAVHGAYIVLRVLQRKPPRFLAVVLSVGVILLLLIPLIPSFTRTLSARGSFTFVDKPRMESLILESVPVFLYGFLIAGLMTAVLLFENTRFSRPKILPPEVWLILMWAAAAPSALFFYSMLSPVSLFLPRYFSVALPGLALTVAWLISLFQPRPARLLITLVLVAGALINRGGPLRNPPHKNEDWRGAMAAVRKITEGKSLPVLTRSDFIESADPAKFADPQQAEFLMAPQFVYPPGGNIIPLPVRADDRAFKRLETIVEQILLKGDQFILVSVKDDGTYRVWLKGRLQSSSFSIRDLGNFGRISVDLFERN